MSRLKLFTFNFCMELDFCVKLFSFRWFGSRIAVQTFVHKRFQFSIKLSFLLLFVVVFSVIVFSNDVDEGVFLVDIKSNFSDGIAIEEARRCLFNLIESSVEFLKIYKNLLLSNFN